MKKKAYKNELQISHEQSRNGRLNDKKDVEKIQSWLTLFSFRNINSGTATEIDGDFGRATEKAVKNFQKVNNLPENGIVDNEVFTSLTTGIKEAFEKPLNGKNLRELVLETAENHLQNYPRELEIRGESNAGPWVRSYMDGNEGRDWFWCMGFVQTILDQAASSMGKSFEDLMPHTYSCDVVGIVGLRKEILTRFDRIRKDPSVIKPGDIFLIRKSEFDWYHTGIIIDVEDDIISTIEGNTNSQGSRNGIAAVKRIRNFMTSNIEVFSIESLTNQQQNFSL